MNVYFRLNFCSTVSSEFKEGKMAPYRYMLLKNKGNKDKSTNTNIVDLLRRTKLQQRREKRQNVYIAAAAISVLALSGFIISQ